MLNDNAAQLRKRLKTIGLSDPAINAAWPMWWSDDADASSSARAELRYSIARKLGLDPHSLLEDDNVPRFVWKEGRDSNISQERAIPKSGPLRLSVQRWVGYSCPELTFRRS